MAIANSLGRPIVIHNHPAGAGGTGDLRVEPRNPSGEAPLEVTYVPGKPGEEHYNTTINGKPIKVTGDGDCLFRAVLMNKAQTKDESSVANQIKGLRGKVGDDIESHAADYEPFLLDD